MSSQKDEVSSTAGWGEYLVAIISSQYLQAVTSFPVAGRTRRKVATGYEALLQQALAARRQNGERLEKVLQLSKKGKLLHERGLVRKHKEVWVKERARLFAEKKQVIDPDLKV